MEELGLKLKTFVDNNFDNIKLFISNYHNFIRKILALSCAIVGIISLIYSKTNSNQTPVWVADRYISPGNKLTTDNLVIKKILKENLPENYISSEEKPTNELVTSGIEKGTILTKSNLLKKYFGGEYKSGTEIVPLNLENSELNNLVKLINVGQKINILEVIPLPTKKTLTNDTYAKKIIDHATVIFVDNNNSKLLDKNNYSPVLVEVPVDKVETLANASTSHKITFSFSD